MPWRNYMTTVDESDHLVFVEWLKMHEWEGPIWKDPSRDTSFVVGRDVDKETWERWEGKVAGAKFAVLNRSAHEPAKTVKVLDKATGRLTTRPAGVSFDERN